MNRLDVGVLDDPAAIGRLIARLAPLEPHKLPLLRAAQAGTIGAMLLCDRTARFPERKLRRFALPTVLLIGDDDEAATGPEGWRCARDATAWAHAGIVHGTGAQALHYGVAVSAALDAKRLLFVETSSAHAATWTTLLSGKPVLKVVPRAGAHPIVSSRGAFH